MTEEESSPTASRFTQEEVTTAKETKKLKVSENDIIPLIYNIEGDQTNDEIDFC